MGNRGISRALVLLVGAVAAACSSGTASKGLVATTSGAGAPTSSEPAATAAGSPTSAPAGTVATPAGGGGSITVGLDSEPPTLDPAGNSLTLANGSIYAALFETLIVDQPGAPLTPGLLAEMPTEAPDRLSWTLRLRPGITFHDGTAFDAKAVKYNLDRQKLSAFNGGGLLLVDAVEPDASDPLTVRVRLSKPWTAFPAVLAGVNGLMSSPTTARGGKSVARNPVGTGPYRFKEWQPGQQVVVERFDGYWGPDKAPLASIAFRFVPIESSRVAAFDAGELDAYTTVVESVADEAEGKGAQIAAPPPTGYGMLMINTSAAPLDDARVRRALAIGYDRDAIAKAYGGQTYADWSSSPFVKGGPWWTAPTEAPSFRPDEARALLADYGQPVGFTLLVLKGSQEIEDALRATADYWQQIGIDVELEVVADVSSYITSVVTGNYQVAGWLAGSLSDPDIVMYNLFHTGAPSNYMKYSSPAMDKALEDGRAATDEATRRQHYADAQAALRADLPVLITSHGQIYIVASKELGGLVPTYFFPSRTVSLAG